MPIFERPAVPPAPPGAQLDSDASADTAAEHIDALMALPIKQPPAVTIFGDDDVVGVTPARTDRG